MGLKDIDILGEMVVQRGDEIFQRMLGSGEKIDHLTLGVGPGIGAAGAPDPDRLARELG
jgi:hypothetical protein